MYIHILTWRRLSVVRRSSSMTPILRLLSGSPSARSTRLNTCRCTAANTKRVTSAAGPGFACVHTHTGTRVYVGRATTLNLPRDFTSHAHTHTQTETERERESESESERVSASAREGGWEIEREGERETRVRTRTRTHKHLYVCIYLYKNKQKK